MTTTTRPARTYAGTPHPAGLLVVQLTAGPVCEPAEHDYIGFFRCPHESCGDIAAERVNGPYDHAGRPRHNDPDLPDDEFFCTVHWTWGGMDEANSFSGGGFAGGDIEHILFTCGCRHDDESDDVRSAV